MLIFAEELHSTDVQRQDTRCAFARPIYFGFGGKAAAIARQLQHPLFFIHSPSGRKVLFSYHAHQSQRIADDIDILNLVEGVGGMPSTMRDVIFGDETYLDRLNASAIIADIAGEPEMRASREAALSALTCRGRPPLRTAKAVLTRGQCRRLRTLIDLRAVAGSPESIDGLPEWQVV
jgi:hypothetical protein